MCSFDLLGNQQNKSLKIKIVFLQFYYKIKIFVLFCLNIFLILQYTNITSFICLIIITINIKGKFKLKKDEKGHFKALKNYFQCRYTS